VVEAASRVVDSEEARAIVGDSVRRWTMRIAIALSTVFFLLANCAGISNPGLEYDELLFVNGALGAPYHYQGFIYHEAWGIPTMLMAYIGALKAWLYYPIFTIFGVSVDSIRLPAVLAGTVVLLLAVRLIYRLFGSWAAAVVAVLLGTDPAYGALARTDWGPIVLSSLFRIAALLFYFAFLRQRSVRYLWLLSATLLLGLYNKLDYGWFIVAFVVAATVVHHRELWEIAHRRLVAVLSPIAIFAVLGVVALFVLVLPAERVPLPGSHASLGDRISEVSRLFRGTFNGAAVYDNMTGSFLRHATLIGWLIPYILIASAIVAVWYLLRGRRRPSSDVLRNVAATTTFFLILFVVMAVGIVLTRQATGAWHVMLLWPLSAFLLVCLLMTATQIPIVRLSRAVVATVLVAIIALTLTQVRTTAEYVDAYRSSRQWGPFWSTEIYAAARTISRAAPRVQSVITVDWGLGTQIFALGNEAVRDRFEDPWPSFTSPAATLAGLRHEWFDDRRVIVIFHAQPAQAEPDTTQRVEAILKSLGSRVRTVYAGKQIEAKEVTPG
jgi:4-amino-4-deoxy-L-arabinose transferase-like glycosyltransferase